MSLIKRKTELGSELNDTGLSGFFFPEVEEVQIVKRFPQSGLPPKGVPLAIDVEVNMEKPTFQYWTGVGNLFCPDATVLVRDENSGQVLGIKPVETEFLKGCKGTVRLSLNPSWRPDNNDNIIIEIYESGTKLGHIEDGQKPEFKTDPIPIFLDYQTGAQSGVYGQESNILNLPNLTAPNLFGDFNSTIKSLTGLVVVGTGGYLIWKNSDTIKKGIKNLTNR